MVAPVAGAAAAPSLMSSLGPSLIGAGGAILGGLMGSASSSDDVQNQIKFQRKAAKNAIRWRVEDAKRAGIHPLYAMGAPGFSPSPVIGGQSNMGDAVKDAAGYLARGLERAQIQAVNASAKRDEAQAALANSQAALAAQQLAANQGAIPLGSVASTQGVKTNRITPVAPEQRSTHALDKSQAAGTNPAWGLVNLGGRYKNVYLPLEDGQPQMPEGLAALMATIAKNMGWFDKKRPYTHKRQRRGWVPHSDDYIAP